MLFLAGVAGILVATVVRFFAYRFLVFNKELDEEPAFSHDHEIMELHHHQNQHPVRVPANEAPDKVEDTDLPGPPRSS
ncbi:hypothetical protein D9M72_629550 [compost metagenome]